MPQFFVDLELKISEETEIRGRDARHISQSLRLGPGDPIVLSDGRGRSFSCRIKSAGPSRVIAEVLREIARRNPAPLPALAIASIRPERLEWAVQKCVELGADLIIPFESSRTVRRPSSGKAARLRKIAEEAAKQSGLPFLPEVADPIDFDALISRMADYSPVFLFHEGESLHTVREALRGPEGRGRRPLIVIGPEGGFTHSEVVAAKAAGALCVNMGEQILRAETAAVAAIAIYQYECGNMGTA